MKEIKLKDVCNYWFEQGVITANLRLIHECMEIINREDDDPRRALNELVSMFLQLNLRAGLKIGEGNTTIEKLIDSNNIIYVEDDEDDTTTSN